MFLGTSIFILPSCKKEENNIYKEYTIKKDNHECEGNRIVRSDNHVNIEYYFDENCLYEDSMLTNGTGWNKLYGIGEVNPLNNSARIWWRSVNKKILLGFFVHDNGTIIAEYADTIDVWEKATGSIQYNKNKVEIKINEKSKIFDSQEPNNPMKCSPYFWWESKAPHDMTIHIKEIAGMLKKTLQNYTSPYPRNTTYFT